MTEVQGYIKDKETKEPLIGAHVILEDMYQGDMVAGTVTDATGYFSMEKRIGTVARISYIGSPRDYYLERNSTELPEAVVTATTSKDFDYRIIIGIVLVILAYYLLQK